MAHHGCLGEREAPLQAGGPAGERQELPRGQWSRLPCWNPLDRFSAAVALAASVIVEAAAAMMLPASANFDRNF